jgi:hypothetical protein
MKLKITLESTQYIETTCETASFDDVLASINKVIEEKGLIIQSLKQESFAGEIIAVASVLQR